MEISPTKTIFNISFANEFSVTKLPERCGVAKPIFVAYGGYEPTMVLKCPGGLKGHYLRFLSGIAYLRLQGGVRLFLETKKTVPNTCSSHFKTLDATKGLM